MKSKELCATAINAGLGNFGKIKYRIKSGDWRYNVGLWVPEENAWSFDCLGFLHCLVNGASFMDKGKLGAGAVMDEFVTHSDEITTLNKYCYNITSDFSKGVPGEMLYMNGHVGLYVGEVQPFNDGRIFNVSECCYSSFGGGGMLTFVDRQGRRFNHYGGTQAGAWEKHGQFYRVDYKDQYDQSENDDPEYNINPIPSVETLTPADILSIANDVFVGKYGNNPERKNELVRLYGEDIYRRVQDIMNLLYY